jgi:integrase
VVTPLFLRELLAAHLATEVRPEEQALVFTSRGGGPLRAGNFHRRLWRPDLNEAGIQYLRPHDLRHTCAALLIATGAHPKAVQAHLGHSSNQVTMDRNGHLFPSDLEALAGRMEETYQASRVDAVWTRCGRGVVAFPGGPPESQAR